MFGVKLLMGISQRFI